MNRSEPAASWLFRYRLLDLAVSVKTNDRAVYAALAATAPRASPHSTAKIFIKMALLRSENGYRIIRPGTSPIFGRSLTLAVKDIQNIAAAELWASRRQASLVQAVSLVRGDQSTLLVGGESSGRSTLAVALSLAGAEVGGDRLAFLEKGIATPFPERFSIWSSSLKFLALRPEAEKFAQLHCGSEVHRRIPIDPVDLGRPWCIRAAPVSDIVFLELNLGGRSRLRPIGASEALKWLMRHCTPPNGSGGTWIGEMCALIASVKVAVLELGSLESALAVLSRYLGGAPRESKALSNGHLS